MGPCCAHVLQWLFQFFHGRRDGSCPSRLQCDRPVHRRNSHTVFSVNRSNKPVLFAYSSPTHLAFHPRGQNASALQILSVQFLRACSPSHHVSSPRHPLFHRHHYAQDGKYFQ